MDPANVTAVFFDATSGTEDQPSGFGVRGFPPPSIQVHI